MHGAPRGRLAHVILLGAPLFALFALLSLGWRVELREAIVACSQGGLRLLTAL